MSSIQASVRVITITLNIAEGGVTEWLGGGGRTVGEDLRVF